MKKTSKRIIALLICVLMVLGAFPAGALAATEAEEVDELQEIMDDLAQVMDADSGKAATTEAEAQEEEETKAAPQVAVQAETMDVPVAAPAAEIISDVLDFGNTSGLADNEWAFILVNETYEYGQDTRSIIIDTGEHTDENGNETDHEIIGARLDASGFNVQNRTGATNISRTVTSAYVRKELGLGNVGDATGRYIVLELETGFDIEGASAYDGNVIALDYSITYTINIVADGQNIFSPNERVLTQTNIVSLIVDEFKYEEKSALT